MGLILVVGFSGLTGCAASPTLVDGDEQGGFAIYRTGRLDPGQLEELCKLGVEELIVMDGTARERECQRRSGVCANLRIRYDQAQDPEVPVRQDFLIAFDQWVEESRGAGRKIAFRCRRGWHRTGRLAAYYRMRFQDWEQAAAADEMLQVGRLMWLYPELQPQVGAMADWLETGSCAQGSGDCPQASRGGSDPTAFPGEEGFARDVCDTSLGGDG